MTYRNLYADGELGTTWHTRDGANRFASRSLLNPRVALVAVKPKVTA